MNILVVNAATAIMQGTLFNESFDPLYTTESEYQARYLGEGYVEQNPLEWQAALREVTLSVMEYLRESGEKLDAIAYTAARSSVIALDQDGKPLRNAIMWEDRRNKEMIRDFDREKEWFYEKCGALPNTIFSGPKMAWIREYEPELYEATYKFCTVGSYLNYCMTGTFRTDTTYGSRSLLMNIRTKEWDPELLARVGVDGEKLCELMMPGSIMGYTTEEFAKSTSVPAGIPVISCGGDQQCSALGAGVISENTLGITAGPGAYIFACGERAPGDVHTGIISSAYPIPDSYVLECTMMNSDSAYRWINQILYGEDGVRPKSFAAIDAAVQETEAGSNGVIALPYFSGRGTPEWDSRAQGGFLHLNLGTTKGDLARSVLESIIYEAVNNLEVLETQMVLPKECFLGGFLSVSKEFCQILADASGLTIKKLLTPIEQVTFGAYLVTGVALGIYADYEDAYFRGRAHLRFRTFDPDPEMKAFYDECRGRMNEMYRRLSKP